MRQDIRFHAGEAVTSRTFAAILSRHLDWLVTVDPHLHRYHALSEIYRIPTQVVHAARLLASWIKRNVARPLIIGPDLESEQWVSQVAADADAPFLVCEKIRSGDRDVTISIPNAPAFLDRQPVLVDDIASSGRPSPRRRASWSAWGSRDRIAWSCIRFSPAMQRKSWVGSSRGS
jgi:ribose-phosphate pyrophosphokinase